MSNFFPYRHRNSSRPVPNPWKHDFIDGKCSSCGERSHVSEKNHTLNALTHDVEGFCSKKFDEIPS